MTTVSGYSRWAGAVLVTSREAPDLHAGWRRLLSEQLLGVPKTLVWDGEGAVGRWRARQPELTSDSRWFSPGAEPPPLPGGPEDP